MAEYIPLTNLVFSFRTVSYGPSFLPFDFWPKREARETNRRRKKRGSVTYGTDRENEVGKIFTVSLLCV